MPMTLINRPCVLIQRSPSPDRDEFGNTIPDETTVTTVCELQQTRRDDVGDTGELGTTTWQAFFLPGQDVGIADALVVDGQEYEFIGEPWPARNPRTHAESHIEATVKRTAGEGAGS